MSDAVTVVALIRAQAGQEEQLGAALQALVEPTHREDGCINYDLHRDLDDPGLFIFHENWESRGHLERHLQSDHIQHFFGLAGALVDGEPQIRVARRV